MRLHVLLHDGRDVLPVDSCGVNDGLDLRLQVDISADAGRLVDVSLHLRRLYDDLVHGGMNNLSVDGVDLRGADDGLQWLDHCLCWISHHCRAACTLPVDSFMIARLRKARTHDGARGPGLRRDRLKDLHAFRTAMRMILG
eukprot:751891-Hanusia_phi.AAC.2